MESLITIISLKMKENLITKASEFTQAIKLPEQFWLEISYSADYRADKILSSIKIE